MADNPYLSSVYRYSTQRRKPVSYSTSVSSTSYRSPTNKTGRGSSNSSSSITAGTGRRAWGISNGSSSSHIYAPSVGGASGVGTTSAAAGGPGGAGYKYRYSSTRTPWQQAPVYGASGSNHLASAGTHSVPSTSHALSSPPLSSGPAGPALSPGFRDAAQGRHGSTLNAVGAVHVGTDGHPDYAQPTDRATTPTRPSTAAQATRHGYSSPSQSTADPLLSSTYRSTGLNSTTGTLVIRDNGQYGGTAMGMFCCFFSVTAWNGASSLTHANT